MGTEAAEKPFSKPLVKWTGGKGDEIRRITSAMPPNPTRLLEPFVGGGALLFAMHPTVIAEVNDISENLVDLYRFQAALDEGLMRSISFIDQAWIAVGEVALGFDDADTALRAGVAASLPLSDCLGVNVAHMQNMITTMALANLRRKRASIVRIARTSVVNGPEAMLASALKGAVYGVIRAAFNDSVRGPERSAMFWFLRDYCYGGMFRHNSFGGFNVPYGGLSYDARTMGWRIEQLMSEATRARLAATRFHCADFEEFMAAARPVNGDFAFFDPPYDTPFSAYDGRSFCRDDHRRLARLMSRLECQWMIVISETDFIRDTYCALPGVTVSASRKTYQGNIKGRYDKETTHLMVTNYRC